MFKLKVYSLKIFIRNNETKKQYTAIVATTSKTKAASILGVKLHYLQKYGSEIKLESWYKIAISKPEKIFVKPIDDLKDNFIGYDRRK